MTIYVISAGPMLTVQDGGRFGLRHMGVSPAGPIDRYIRVKSRVCTRTTAGESPIVRTNLRSKRSILIARSSGNSPAGSARARIRDSGCASARNDLTSRLTEG